MPSTETRVAAPPIEVILNAGAGSGKGESQRSAVEKEFRERGSEVNVSIASPGGLSALVREKARGPGKLIVAGGGDGTISGVAAELAGTDKILGVLPLGTLNHFSKDLGIPQELPAAVDVLFNGQVSRVDVGEVNGRIFVNNSSLGVYPLVVADRVGQQKRLKRGKWTAFGAAVVHLLQRYPRVQLHMTIEGKKLSRRSPFLFVGNNAYELAGFNLGARRCLDAGQLGLYLTNRTGRFALFGLLARALVGRLQQERDFEAYCVTEARIETTHRDLLVAADGEVFRLKGPLHYRVRPGALHVMKPLPKEKT